MKDRIDSTTFNRSKSSSRCHTMLRMPAISYDINKITSSKWGMHQFGKESKARENTTFAVLDILVEDSSALIKHGTHFNISIISS